MYALKKLSTTSHEDSLRRVGRVLVGSGAGSKGGDVVGALDGAVRVGVVEVCSVTVAGEEQAPSSMAEATAIPTVRGAGRCGRQSDGATNVVRRDGQRSACWKGVRIVILTGEQNHPERR